VRGVSYQNLPGAAVRSSTKEWAHLIYMIPYFAYRSLILDCQPLRGLSTDLNVFVRVGEV